MLLKPGSINKKTNNDVGAEAQQTLSRLRPRPRVCDVNFQLLFPHCKKMHAHILNYFSVLIDEDPCIIPLSIYKNIMPLSNNK